MSRIVLVVGKATGGIGVHVRDLATGLTNLGHEVVVVTDPLTARTFELPGAQLLWPSPRRPHPRSITRLRALLRSADVVHSHGHQAGIVAATALPRRNRGRHARRTPALVISLHNELPDLSGPVGAAARTAERSALRRADLVTGASGDLVQAALRQGARTARLARVPSPRVPALLAASTGDREAARARVRAAYGLGEGSALVVTVSRIAPQKNLSGLLEAAGRVHVPVDWLVAGSGDAPLLTDLTARVARARLPVRFVGSVAAADELILAADLFVLTSLWEARALVVQEAMAAGTAVIAPAVGGLPDLLADTEAGDRPAGALVAPRDPAATAAAIDALLRDDEYREALARRAREVALTWPDTRECVREWAAAYDGLLGGIA